MGVFVDKLIHYAYAAFEQRDVLTCVYDVDEEQFNLKLFIDIVAAVEKLHGSRCRGNGLPSCSIRSGPVKSLGNVYVKFVTNLMPSPLVFDLHFRVGKIVFTFQVQQFTFVGIT